MKKKNSSTTNFSAILLLIVGFFSGFMTEGIVKYPITDITEKATAEKVINTTVKTTNESMELDGNDEDVTDITSNNHKKSKSQSGAGESIEDFKVEKVYDGDTIYITVSDVPDVMGNNIGVRIFGIDTPESRTKDDCEKRASKKSKAELQSLIDNAKKIKLTDCQRDKYFRLLCKVDIDGLDVSKHLIEKGLAYEYYGDAKSLHKPDYCELEKKH